MTKLGGKGSRRKGHAFERKIANRLKAVWPNAKRGYQGRDGGAAPDVEGTPYWIECKRRVRPNIPAAMRQAVEAGGEGAVPVAITQADRDRPGAPAKPVYVTMILEDWMDVMGQFEDEKAMGRILDTIVRKS